VGGEVLGDDTGYWLLDIRKSKVNAKFIKLG
jgi:hypothetical protein